MFGIAMFNMYWNQLLDLSVLLNFPYFFRRYPISSKVQNGNIEEVHPQFINIST
jgi:hypothetical protein